MYKRQVPEIVRQQEFVDVVTDNHGRIFFDKNEQTFKVTAGNKTDSACDRKIVSSVLKNGRLISSKSEDIHLEAGEIVEKEITTKAGGYGYYDLRVELCDGNKNVKTVSYTHLDVYKRQIVGGTAYISLTSLKPDTATHNTGSRHISPMSINIENIPQYNILY